MFQSHGGWKFCMSRFLAKGGGTSGLSFSVQNSSKESELDNTLVSVSKNQENKMNINNLLSKIGIRFP